MELVPNEVPLSSLDVEKSNSSSSSTFGCLWTDAECVAQEILAAQLDENRHMEFRMADVQQSESPGSSSSSSLKEEPGMLPQAIFVEEKEPASWSFAEFTGKAVFWDDSQHALVVTSAEALLSSASSYFPLSLPSCVRFDSYRPAPPDLLNDEEDTAAAAVDPVHVERISVDSAGDKECAASRPAEPASNQATPHLRQPVSAAGLSLPLFISIPFSLLLPGHRDLHITVLELGHEFDGSESSRPLFDRSFSGRLLFPDESLLERMLPVGFSLEVCADGDAQHPAVGRLCQVHLQDSLSDVIGPVIRSIYVREVPSAAVADAGSDRGDSVAPAREYSFAEMALGMPRQRVHAGFQETLLILHRCLCHPLLNALWRIIAGCRQYCRHLCDDCTVCKETAAAAEAMLRLPSGPFANCLFTTFCDSVLRPQLEAAAHCMREERVNDAGARRQLEEIERVYEQFGRRLREHVLHVRRSAAASS